MNFESSGGPGYAPELPKLSLVPEEQNKAAPTFFVRDLPVYGDVVLAPMAGFADIPTRAMCRRFGSAMNYSEFVAVEDIINCSTRVQALLDFTADDRPMVFQIFGNDAGCILRAAQQIEELGPDIIDVNLGCSTRRVSGRGAGVGMMRDPGLVAETFNLLSSHLSVPVTGKIRLGWEDTQNYLEVARILEDNGAALIALHPRTKEQGYREAARWDAIAALREAVSVPVIGNGDVVTPKDIDAMISQTGCHSVMIGRGAVGNPWIFARLEKKELEIPALIQVIKDHLNLMLAYYAERGLVLFRKHLKRYLGGMPALKATYRQMVTNGTVDGVLTSLDYIESQFGMQTVGALMA